MVKDTLNSIFDNLKERTTNPFLGTLIVVWIIKNWELVYALLSFNSNSNLYSRQAYIKQYFDDQPFVWNMACVVLITLVVLVGTYFFLSLSRLLTDTYEKIILPFISRLTDKSSVVLKVDYLALKEAYSQLEVRLEEERLAKVSAQNERDAVDKRLMEKSITTEDEPAVTEQNSSVEVSEVSIPQARKYRRIIKKLSAEWSIDKYIFVMDEILEGNEFPLRDSYTSSLLKFLLREGLVSLSSSTSSGRYYILTSDGESLLKYINEVSDEVQKD